jgi:hypothetical protein
VSSTASWWVKVARANKHLVQLKRAIRRYTDGRPYEAVSVVKTQDNYENTGVHIRITRQPDDELAAIIGDVVHNLRSALDHIVGALAPPERYRSAAFPIIPENLWLRDGNRRFISRDSKARRDYRIRVEGLDPQAKAIILAAQPFHAGDEAKTRPLAFLNDLENADKHRSLIVTASVISSAWVNIRAHSWSGTASFPGQHEDSTHQVVISTPLILPPNIAVVSLDELDALGLGDDFRRLIETAPPKGEVNVDPSAAIAVHVKARRNSRRSEDAIAFLKVAIREVSKILRDLEPFVNKGVRPKA